MKSRTPVCDIFKADLRAVVGKVRILYRTASFPSVDTSTVHARLCYITCVVIVEMRILLGLFTTTPRHLNETHGLQRPNQQLWYVGKTRIAVLRFLVHSFP